MGTLEGCSGPISRQLTQSWLSNLILRREPPHRQSGLPQKARCHVLASPGWSLAVPFGGPTALAETPPQGETTTLEQFVLDSDALRHMAPATFVER
jgi:hypothetical protein